MTRYMLTLNSPAERARAHRWVDGLPDGTRMEVKKPRRTLPQNDLFWMLLTEISEQREHFGRKLTPEQWKLLFLRALKKELDIVPALDGVHMVQISGHSSSDLSTEEMSELIELIYAYGAEHRIQFRSAA